ncbi:MAG: alpha/beta hydrolase [Phycisphaerae bacterium]|nr:alpha/beta hydrolase [Phycisphaerae bacterium]
MLNRISRHGSLIRLAAIISLAVCIANVGGCLTLPGGEVPDEPQPPPYLTSLLALGIQAEMDRVARMIPQNLKNLPAVDGEAPYDVETIRNVPFIDRPTRLLTVDVHRPTVNNGQLRRCVVLYMGGGYITDYDFETIGVWAEYLASRGFVAFNTRQRLITEENVGLREVYADAIAAVRFVTTNAQTWGGDPNRIGLLGRSSGGQVALVVGMIPDPDFFGPAGDPNVPVRVGTIVDFFGSTDDSRFFTTNEFTLLPRESLAAAYGGTPDKVPQVYRDFAPLTYVRPGLPPIMIVHGALDTTIPPIHSVLLADALEAAGNVVRREFYREFGHVIGWGLINNEGFGRAMEAAIHFMRDRL